MCHGNTLHCWMYIMSTNINRVYQKEFSQPNSRQLDFWSHQSCPSLSSGIQAPGKVGSWESDSQAFLFPQHLLSENDGIGQKIYAKMTQINGKWQQMTEISTNMTKDDKKWGKFPRFPGTVSRNFNISWDNWYVSLMYQRSISWGLISITVSVCWSWRSMMMIMIVELITMITMMIMMITMIRMMITMINDSFMWKHGNWSEPAITRLIGRLCLST